MSFLFVDRILILNPGEYVSGIKHITSDDLYLTKSENGEIIFPTALIGETLGQLAAWNVMFSKQFKCRPVAGVVSSVRVFRPAFLGETLCLESFIDSLDDAVVAYHSQAKINDEIVFSIDGALGPLLPMEKFISDSEIKNQFDEINRPYDKVWSNSTVKQLLNNHLKIKPMQFCFDYLVAFEPGHQLVAEKKISKAGPWFPDHFPLHPVLPLTILLECKMNLAQYFLQHSGFSGYTLHELRKIKMNVFVHPGDVIRSCLQVKMQTENEVILSVKSEVEEKRVCIVEMVFTRIEMNKKHH